MKYIVAFDKPVDNKFFIDGFIDNVINDVIGNTICLFSHVFGALSSSNPYIIGYKLRLAGSSNLNLLDDDASVPMLMMPGDDDDDARR